MASVVGTTPAAKLSKEILPAVPRNEVSVQKRSVLQDSWFMKNNQLYLQVT